MQKPQIALPKALWMTIGLLSASLSAQLFAFEQGSCFLIDIREDATASDTEERIVVAASVFQFKEVKSATQLAEKKVKSEFETEITSFGRAKTTLDSTGTEALELETDSPKSESSFGDSSPAASGFFFTY